MNKGNNSKQLQININMTEVLENNMAVWVQQLYSIINNECV